MNTVSRSPSLLAGMRVLSFTHFVQGPAAAQYLADMGADVIKIEPLQGAFERGYGADSVFVEGLSASFFAVNRNCRSVSLDLKSAHAREVVHALLREADVLLENYRGGVLDRLGLGHEAVKAIKPDIIYASASGWGSSGPMAATKARRRRATQCCTPPSTRSAVRRRSLMRTRTTRLP